MLARLMELLDKIHNVFWFFGCSAKATLYKYRTQGVDRHLYAVFA